MTIHVDSFINKTDNIALICKNIIIKNNNNYMLIIIHVVLCDMSIKIFWEREIIITAIVISRKRFLIKSDVENIRD